MSKPNTFDNARAALVIFDADRPRRDAIIKNISHRAEVFAWEAEEKLALEKVQIAFHQDTAHFNRLENCMRMGENWMREMVLKHGPKE